MAQGKIHRLSPSALKLGEECENCLWLERNKGIKRPPSIMPSLPNGMDRVYKSYFDYYRERGELPTELTPLVEPGAQLFSDQRVLNVWRQNFGGIQAVDKDSNILRGAVDDVLIEKGRISVFDFKTRGSPPKDDTCPHYQLQLDAYAWLFTKNGYKVNEHGYLYFIIPTKVCGPGLVEFSIHIQRLPVSPLRAEQAFENTVRMLNGPQPTKRCPHCQHIQ